MEAFISGYCRVMDGARTVFLEDDEADCAYPSCTYASECPIAAEIRRSLNEKKEEK